MIRAMVAPVLHAIEQDTNNAFITVDRDGAMAARSASLARRSAGESFGPLDGVPIGIKDCIDTAGLRTTLGSGVFAERVPTADATVVARLREAGAVIVGKTHCTELCCGTTGLNDWFGEARNPHDPTRYPGGSSSGSAIAVASGLVPVALGSDTSCSIRQPAAACGVVGFKPTFGRVPTDGVSVCSRHLDHVGPIARSVTEAIDVLRVIQDSGWDDLRPGPIERSALRVGVLQGDVLELATPDVVAAFEAGLEVLEASGWRLGRVDLGIDLDGTDDHANTLCADLMEEYGQALRAADPERIGADLRHWLDLFESVDPVMYAAALDAKSHVTRVVEQAFESWDVLLCPTIRKGAGLLTEASAEDREPRVGNCSLWDMTGQPSLTVPLGSDARLTDCNGMPLGLLINAKRGADALALQVGTLVEADLERAGQ